MTRKQPKPLDQEAFAHQIMAARDHVLLASHTATTIMTTTRCPIGTATAAPPDPASTVVSLWLANVHANQLSLELNRALDDLMRVADELCKARPIPPSKEAK